MRKMKREASSVKARKQRKIVAAEAKKATKVEKKLAAEAAARK